MGVAKGPGLSRGFSEGFWKFREGSGNSEKASGNSGKVLEIQERFWKRFWKFRELDLQKHTT